MMHEIGLMFSGQYGYTEEVAKMREEILEGPIPGIGADKQNLRSDATAIKGDISKAFSEYKKKF